MILRATVALSRAGGTVRDMRKARGGKLLLLIFETARTLHDPPD